MNEVTMTGLVPANSISLFRTAIGRAKNGRHISVREYTDHLPTVDDERAP